jgi:hypothetical protein
MIEGQSNEIVLVFHSDKEEDRKMKAFLETIDVFGVRAVDLKTEKLSERDVEDIAGKLDADIGDLFDPAGADRMKSLSREEALKLLASDSLLLSTPIIIIGEHAYQFESSSEFIHETAMMSTIRHNPID